MKRETMRLSATSVIAGDVIESLDRSGAQFPVLAVKRESSTTGVHTILLQLEMPSRSKRWYEYDPSDEFLVHREAHRVTS